MAERITAGRQLARILQLIPLAAREDGASLSALAKATNSSEKDVERDLQEVFTRTFYQPAGSVDDIQIVFEEDRVSVWTTGEFQRPVRLGPEESIATALALRVLAAGSGDDGGEMLRLAELLERKLLDRSVTDVTRQLSLSPAALTAGGPHEALAASARDLRPCRIRYLKAGAEVPDERTIEPYVLINQADRWYVIGRCRQSDAVRVFRLDRVLAADPVDGSFAPPDDFDAGAYVADGRVFRADEFEEAAVRYSPRVARYIAELGPVAPLDDGSAVVRYAVADRRWLLRHLLEFGPDAELLEPKELRAELVTLVRSLIDTGGAAEA